MAMFPVFMFENVMKMMGRQKTLHKNVLQFVTASRILTGILSKNLENYEQSQNLCSIFFKCGIQKVYS